MNKEIEYKHLVITAKDGFEELGILGLDGWDLVTVIPRTGQFLYILKRFK